MKEGYWVIRTYESGSVGEKTKFWIPGTRPTGKTRRREKDAVKKQEQNEYSAQKQMARLMNANFDGGDLLLGLDYSDDGLARLEAWAREKWSEFDSADEVQKLEYIREAAERELRLVLRRVKRELAKDGVELRYIAITSDMDGQTGESVRVHHHLMVGKEVKAAFVGKWKQLGHVAWSPLWDYQDDRTQIAEYFIKQVRRIPDAKKYISSRNLIRPKPEDRVALSDAELRVPKGGQLLFRQEFKPGRPQYIRYTLPQKNRYRNPDSGDTGQA